MSEYVSTDTDADTDIDIDFSREALLDMVYAVEDVLDLPSKWCQGAIAKNDRGDSVDYCDSSATSWCLLGAVLKVGFYFSDDSNELIDLIDKFIPVGGIERWNDHKGRTYDEVMDIVNIAAESLES